MNDVSIVIVNWNTKDFLKKCLDSVYSHINGISFEVLVVDNASSDGSVEMVKNRFLQVRLIINDKNLGFARANNQAIRISNGRYLLLLNSDTVVLKDTILEMVRFMDSHPRAGIAGSKLLNPDATLQLSCYNIPTLRRVFFEYTFLSRILPFNSGEIILHFKHNKEKEVGYVSGACFMIRKRLLDEIGLLDERFFMFAEEADLCLRAHKRRWKVFFIPQAEVIHYGRQSVINYGLSAMSGIKWRSNRIFFIKHYGSFIATLFTSFVFLIIALRLFFLTITLILNRRDSRQIREKIRLYAASLKIMMLQGNRRNITDLERSNLEMYSKIAKEYDKDRFGSAAGKLFAEIEDDLIVRMLGPDFLKNCLMLDVAAGTGRISLSMSVRGAHVVAVDQSINMLQEAKSKAQDINVGNIRFVVANARKLPFKDEVFDVLTSIRFLTIIPPQHFSPYLGEMKRVLKSEGFLIAESLNKLDLREMIRIKGRRQSPWPWQISQAFKGMKILEKKGCWFPAHRRIANINRNWAIKLARLGNYFPFYYFTSQVLVKAVKTDEK
jgi:hypothetical protein